MSDWFAIDIRDGRRGTFLLGLAKTKLEFLLETLRPDALLGLGGDFESEGVTLEAYAVFDTDRHLFDVRIDDAVPMTGRGRALYAALLAAVWAPARTSLSPSPTGDAGAVTAEDVAAFVTEIDTDSRRALYEALHEAGLGHDPPGRGFRPFESDDELKWCTMQAVRRAVAKAEKSP